MKDVTSFKVLNLALADAHLIIALTYKKKKKPICIKSDLAF